MMPHLQQHLGHELQHGHAHGAGLWLLIGAVVAAAVLYSALALRQGIGARRPWSAWRVAGFLGGSSLVVVALWPPLVPYPDGDFREHMLQHLLIGMIAPILLVLAAPITLLLRSLPAWHARRVARLIRSGPVHVLANPMVALLLNVGGMAALYFTPLYLAMQQSPLLHLLVHVHFLLAGCLFAWVIAGPDPAPNRPSVPARLVLLGIAIFVHATLAQLLYAGLFVAVSVPPEQLRGGAELMYYGGDLAELGLAFALVSSWRPRREAARGVLATTRALDARD